MIDHKVYPRRSDEAFIREEELAWRIATVAADPTPIDDDVAAMVINRIIDNAAVAAAALVRPPAVVARAQALSHRTTPGGTVFGLPHEVRVSPEWAAWANGVAVRDLDYHDTYLEEEYSHPGDNIPAILAVGQHAGIRLDLRGADIVRAIATAYEIQIDLCRGMSLHKHRIDHVAHLGPSAVAGIGALLALEPETIYQAVGQALHTTTATRQSRKGAISTWKAYAPSFATKVAIESVDRAMRGQTSPSPIYEGEDGVIAWLLDGPDASYSIPLPSVGESKRSILDSYTKEYSAEYQAQAWIDVALRLHHRRPEIADGAEIREVVITTSHHTHQVIGSGSHDPQKYDPGASRETLDHSLPYIFAVALQDGGWHHVASYTSERANRPDTVALWRKIRTVESDEWSRRYLSRDPRERAFGGSVTVTLTDGSAITEEISVPDAHPRGSRPFGREEYIGKFMTLSAESVDRSEAERFVEAVLQLQELSAPEFDRLTFTARPGLLDRHTSPEGLI